MENDEVEDAFLGVIPTVILRLLAQELKREDTKTEKENPRPNIGTAWVPK